MGLLILIICIAFCFLAEWVGNKRYSSGVLTSLLYVTGVVGIIIIAFGSIIAPFNYAGYNSDLKWQQNNLKIDQERCDELLPQLTAVLDKYASYEGDTNKMFQGKGSMISVPPNLKNNTVIIKRVDEVRDAFDEVYEDRKNISEDIILIDQNYRVGRWFAVYVPH